MPESRVSLACSVSLISYICGVRFTAHLSCCDCSLFCSPPYRTRALTSSLDSFILGDCPVSWLEPCFIGQLLVIDCPCQVSLAAAPCSILGSLVLTASVKYPLPSPCELWESGGCSVPVGPAQLGFPISFLYLKFSEYFRKKLLLPSNPYPHHLTTCYCFLALPLNGAGREVLKNNKFSPEGFFFKQKNTLLFYVLIGVCSKALQYVMDLLGLRCFLLAEVT